MDFFKDFFSNAGSKGAPAAGGGLASKFLQNKVVNPFVTDYRKKNPTTDGKPGLLETLAPFAPGVLGVAMLNKKNDAMSYAGAGMIGAAAADGGEQTFDFLKGDDSNRLADSLDDIFKRMKK